jgi:shikimate dehydrogenase
MTIADLVLNKILVPASLPPDSLYAPEDTSPLIVTLLAEDYPARSAQLWNATHRTFGMEERSCVMIAHPKNVAQILDIFRTDPRYHGGGTGVGFKEITLAHLDDITPLAKAMGAINIIKKSSEGRLIGHNTDGIGYSTGLKNVLKKVGKEIRSAHILILGAGGSGRAIAFALAQEGAHLTILNRTESKAIELAHTINIFIGRSVATGGSRALIPEIVPSQDAVISVVDDVHSPLDAYSPLGHMELPVTTAGIGENKKQTDVLLTTAKQNVIVSDIRIRTIETPMLAYAREKSFPILDGLPMVLNQAVLAFQWVYEDQLKEKGVTLPQIEEVMNECFLI